MKPDDELVQSYIDNGWALIPDVLPADQVAASRALLEGTDVRAAGGEDGLRADPKVLLMLEIVSALRLRHPHFDLLAHDVSIAALAAELMGPWGHEGVVLLEDRAIIKRVSPDARPTLWHQDFNTFPIDRSGALTIWIALQDVEPEMGGLWFLSGSHRLGPLGQVNIFADEPYAHRPDLLPAMREAERSPVPVPAGSALVFDAFTLHGAGANTTETERMALSFAYLPASTQFTGKATAATIADDMTVGATFPRDFFPHFPAPQDLIR